MKRFCTKKKLVINTQRQRTKITALCSLLTALCYLSCSFDYTEFEPTDDILPGLVMENVEYVRVKSKEPQAKFQADRAEHYDKQSLMKLENIVFEQFGSTVEEVNAQGRIGNAVMETDSGNILMENGVIIEVESEDIVIETENLAWKDELRTLSTGEDEEVSITMKNGTNFIGIGFIADTRRRTWEFKNSVKGEYIFEDDEEVEVEEEDEVNNESE